MCGLAGFAKIKNNDTKLKLTSALGHAIDTRGGNAIGFVSIKDGITYAAKTSDTWEQAPLDFIVEASEADTLLMHSRFATCGNKEKVSQAHPFAIRRKGKAVLYGAHNGVIWDAWASARHHSRHIDVDSEEIFHLIADSTWNILNILQGYGVAMWVKAGTDYVNLARLTKESEICVIEVEGGGLVWGSTWQIVSYALKVAELKAVAAHPCKEVGRVYRLNEKGVFPSNLNKVKVVFPFATT